MRDPDIVEEHRTDRGILVQCVRTSADIRAEFPWMAEFLWSARHPNGSMFRMGVGDSEQAAINQLVDHYPELGRRAA
jgi:hypothetical protein